MENLEAIGSEVVNCPSVRGYLCVPPISSLPCYLFRYSDLAHPSVCLCAAREMFLRGERPEQ